MPRLLCGSSSSATSSRAVFNIPNGDLAASRAPSFAAGTQRPADVINLAGNGTYTLTAVDNSHRRREWSAGNRHDVAGLDLTIKCNRATIQRMSGRGVPEFAFCRSGMARRRPAMPNDKKREGG